MTFERTPEQEAVYQQFLAEATELIIEMNRRISEQGNREANFCVAGCSACCFQLFEVRQAHFMVILDWITSNPELRARFDELNARRKALIAEKFETIKEIAQIGNDVEFMRKWVALGIPCALLDEGKCLIYAVRPSACSTYLTLSPPRVCAIDPKGYLSNPMKQLKQEFGLELDRIAEKYRVTREKLYDLSWHLDNVLNTKNDEEKEEP